MKRLILALMLSAFAACSSGVDPTVKCPGGDKQLSRAEWIACYGVQEEDTD